MMDLEHERRIGRLVFYFLQGKLDDSEQKELEEWRRASVEHEEIFLRMQSAAYLEESFRRFVKSEEEKEREWKSIRNRCLQKKKGISPKFRRYAALWILPFLLVGGIFYAVKTEKPKDTLPDGVAFCPGQSYAILKLADGTRINLQEKTDFPEPDNRNWEITHDSLKYRIAESMPITEWHTLQIPRGGEYTLILSDGTKVFLNAESKLRYPVNFTGNTRKVVLDGEAYFEVHRDSLHPFIVGAGQIEVKVLGTSFGVRAYTEESKIRTTLITGKVNVKAEGNHVSLSPDQQAVFDKESCYLTRETVNTELFVGWKDGRLVFDNCPLEDVLTDLGRWYSFEVFYANPSVKNIPFSLNIRKHEKFSEVLKLMQKTGKIHFDVDKNTVIVK